MNDSISDNISTTKIHQTLQQLLAGYLSEKAESQRDDDTQFIGYWDSACQTIYDVAAALRIPLEQQPGTPLCLSPAWGSIPLKEEPRFRVVGESSVGGRGTRRGG